MKRPGQLDMSPEGEPVPAKEGKVSVRSPYA